MDNIVPVIATILSDGPSVQLLIATAHYYINAAKILWFNLEV